MEKKPLLRDGISATQGHDSRNRDRRPSKNALRFVLPFTLVLFVITWVFIFLGMQDFIMDSCGWSKSGADRILSKHPLIDGHNDLLFLIRAVWGDRIYDSNFTEPFENGKMIGHFDLRKADQSRMGGTFWSA